MGNTKDYDEEPVYYCRTCLSLGIKYEPYTDTDCCTNCGSTDIGQASIEEWEEMFEKRHNHKPITKTEDPRKSYMWKLSYSELLDKVYNHPNWRDIILDIYPSFPRSYSKADSVILFFDKLSKERRFDELKTLLIKKHL